jgi:hypothetical protein
MTSNLVIRYSQSLPSAVESNFPKLHLVVFKIGVPTQRAKHVTLYTVCENFSNRIVGLVFMRKL